MKYDVVIIGAGITGTLIARELSRYELKIAVVEKGDDAATGTTKANSAIIHGGFDPKPGTLKAKFNVKGTAMMEALANELEVPFRKNGSLVLAFNEEDMLVVKQLYDRGIENGVPDMEILGAEDLHKLEPKVSDKAVGALLSKSAGIVCPYKLAIAALGNAMDNGVKFFPCFEVKNIKINKGRFEVSSNEQKITGRVIINCAGVYSDNIARMIGDDSFTITPRKGEYILLDKDEGDLVSHTLFQVPTAAGKGVLVTPTVDGNILIGPTSVLVDSKEDLDTTAAGMEFIKNTAQKSVNHLNIRSVITSFAGLRAVPNTGDFIIGPSAINPNFINVAGIESPGLSAAPAIAEYVIDIIKAIGIELSKNKSFIGHEKSYHSFKHLDNEEKNVIIQQDARYGHIVCRCETITEGEIVEAIHRNPPARSVDAVKRRTRSGMGRCQGGFCTTYIVDILAKELGMPPEKITKFGKGSNLLMGRTKYGHII